MKTSAFIAILMAGVTVLSATNDITSETFRCRELAKVTTEISADVLVSYDLTTGVWKTPAEDSYEFEKDGALTIFTEDKKQDVEVKVSTWEVEMVDDQVVLTVNKNKSSFFSYWVEQTCEGILLTDVRTGEVLTLEHSALTMPGHSNKVKSNLKTYVVCSGVIYGEG